MENNSFLKIKSSKVQQNKNRGEKIQTTGFIGQKMLFIFASFDRDEIVDGYVIYYVKKLSELGDVIFVSDNNLSEKEKNKVKKYTIKIIAKRHGKYDFGSYSIGINYAQRKGILEKYDWVVICNDSVYGPIFSLEKILSKIKTEDADVWGFSKENHIISHVQSYFVALSIKVISDKRILNFFKGVKKQKNRELVVFYYELGLSALFLSCDYTFDSFFKNSSFFKFEPSSKKDYISILKKGFPFIKKKLLIENPCILNKFNINKIQKIAPNYPLSMVKKNVNRFAVSKNPVSDFLIFYFKYSIFIRTLRLIYLVIKKRIFLIFF
jgi:lipopolysaccharide biosynthesis protein